MHAELKPPIFLFGNHRSGTTLTQKLIGLHPDIVTWFEPRTLWRCADPARSHDEFSQADASEEVISYIRNRFLKYQMKHGNRQIMENTPSNILRISYVNAIFPEAILLFITRNPFSCISSMELKWHRSKTWRGVLRTLSATPPTQIHFYAKVALRELVIRKLVKQERVFGPLYKGIREDLAAHGKLKVIARQWAWCNRIARGELAKLEKNRILSFRYEDLINDVECTVRSIYGHCGLSCDQQVIDTAKVMVDPGRQEKWMRLDLEDLASILPEIDEEMRVYGYNIPHPIQKRMEKTSHLLDHVHGAKG